MRPKPMKLEHGRFIQLWNPCIITVIFHGKIFVLFWRFAKDINVHPGMLRPFKLIDENGVDAVRYWIVTSRLGTILFLTQHAKTGRSWWTNFECDQIAKRLKAIKPFPQWKNRRSGFCGTASLNGWSLNWWQRFQQPHSTWPYDYNRFGQDRAVFLGYFLWQLFRASKIISTDQAANGAACLEFAIDKIPRLFALCPLLKCYTKTWISRVAGSHQAASVGNGQPILRLMGMIQRTLLIPKSCQQFEVKIYHGHIHQICCR